MKVYGIGNPLIDILIQVSDDDIASLGLAKGTMHLVDLEERSRILAFLEGRPVEYRCGGSCPNTIIALASLGVDARLGGKVGKDQEGDEYIRQLASFSSHSSLSRGEGVTGSSIILITPDTERTMNTYLGANREYGLADLELSKVREAEYFYFTGYMWDTEDQKAAILKGIEVCRESGTRVVFDAADPFAVNRNRDEFLKLLESHVDIFFANAEEAGILFDCDTVAGCIESLAGFCEVAVIKNGRIGSVVHSASGEDHIPVNRVTAVDSTGAGDMYAAGFLYGLIQGYSMRDCGLCASWLASRIVQFRGAQFTRAEFAAIRRGFDAGDWRI
jgi:sugar/nucleoside kinase (ribokinase family)